MFMQFCRVLKHKKLSLVFSITEKHLDVITYEELNLKDTNVYIDNQVKKYLMKLRSSSHKYSLMRRQGRNRSYYNSPFACYLVYMFLE